MSRLTATRAALDLIQSFEGFRAKAVQLAGGRYTVGYGHVATAREGASVTREQAEALLLWDLRPVEDAIRRSVHAPISQSQFDALVSFVFNIGTEPFLASSVLRHINAGEPVAAALAMGLWRRGRVGGKLMVVDALVRRRAAEAALFLEPVEMRPAAPSPVLVPHPDLEGSQPHAVSLADAPATEDGSTADDLTPDAAPQEAEALLDAASAEAPDRPADTAADPAPDESDPVVIAERIRYRVEQILAEGAPAGSGRLHQSPQDPQPAAQPEPPTAPQLRDPTGAPGAGDTVARSAPPLISNDRLPPGRVALEMLAPANGLPVPGAAPLEANGAGGGVARRSDAYHPPSLTPFPGAADPAAMLQPAAPTPQMPPVPANGPGNVILPPPANDGDLTAAMELARRAPDPTVIVMGRGAGVPDPLSDTPEARLAALREKIAGGGASVAAEPRPAASAAGTWNTMLSWLLLGGGLGALLFGLINASGMGLFQVTNTPAPLDAAEQAALGSAALGLLGVVVGIVGLTARRPD
jgi:lysozyme